MLTVSQSCLTLCDPMDYGPSGSSVHGIFQARILQWKYYSHFLLQEIFLTQGSNPCRLCCRRILSLAEPPEKPNYGLKKDKSVHLKLVILKSLCRFMFSSSQGY